MREMRQKPESQIILQPRPRLQGDVLEEGKQAQLDLDFLDAAWKGNLPEVKKLLAEGADIGAQSTRGTSALMWGATTQHTEVCRFLLEKGADVNAKDRSNWTALHWAASHGDTKTCNMLCSKGADIYVKTDTGSTAFDFAESFEYQHKNPGTAKFLKFFEDSEKLLGRETAAHFAEHFLGCISPS